jgi:hypothetical protein
MFIRHLIGPRKGEIEDLVFDRAKAKVEAGEAEDIYHQLGPAPRPTSVAADLQIDAAKVDTPRDSKKKSRR